MSSDTAEGRLLLLTESPRRTTVINSACTLREQDGVCAVAVHGLPAFLFRRDDCVNARVAALQLDELGYAPAEELEAVAGCNKRTPFRARQHWLAGGAAALVPDKRGPGGPPQVRSPGLSDGRTRVCKERMAGRLGVIASAPGERRAPVASPQPVVPLNASEPHPFDTEPAKATLAIMAAGFNLVIDRRSAARTPAPAPSPRRRYRRACRCGTGSPWA